MPERYTRQWVSSSKGVSQACVRSRVVESLQNDLTHTRTPAKQSSPMLGRVATLESHHRGEIDWNVKK